MRTIIIYPKPETLSEIARDVGQVFFATMFVGPIIQEDIHFGLVIIGLILSISFWSISLKLS